MTQTRKIIETAEFNPRIKTYIFILGALILLVSILGIPLLIFWLIGLGQYYSKRYYQSLECRLTNRQLEFKKGIFFTVEKTIPLENIQDLTFLDNPVLRMFDLRILKIETAGQSNPKGSDMKLIGICNFAAFKDRVMDQREQLRSDPRRTEGDAERNEDHTVSLLRDIKSLLAEIKGRLPDREEGSIRH